MLIDQSTVKIRMWRQLASRRTAPCTANNSAHSAVTYGMRMEQARVTRLLGTEYGVD